MIEKHRKEQGCYAGMKRDQFGRQIEQLLEVVISGVVPGDVERGPLSLLADEVRSFACRDTRVVAFGGGTGLSTVVGGNSQLADWPADPFIGLKQEFPLLDVVVCTTDDGGSTGLLLQQLPVIGIGDLRKLLLSLVLRDDLRAAYSLDDDGAMRLIRLIHGIFNHRFPFECDDFSVVSNPLSVVPKELQRACPESLSQLLGSLGRYVSPGGEGPLIKPGGHCLGNLLLLAAFFRETSGAGDEPPPLQTITKGLDTIAGAIGAVRGRLHPATATPGQLILRYSNGVAVRGQCKTARSRRDFPIDSVAVEFSDEPVVNWKLYRIIREADLIIFAPGSLYTSILPILQLPDIVTAIRENRKALKILAANFWIQEGETDISRRGRNRGFYVSELVEAYDQNVPGGAQGLFDVVLSANLEYVPGNVLSNYALEGKSPIYLDRERVERFGVLPVEATIYSRERLRLAHVIHHDPRKFALAVRALLFAHERYSLKRESFWPFGSYPAAPDRGTVRAPLLCSYRRRTGEALKGKLFAPIELREVFEELVWENRDIRIDHFKFFRGASVIPAGGWGRRNEWDNVLGYYDPAVGMLEMHEQLLSDREKLKGNLLIAMGESLLGRYLEGRRWIEWRDDREWGARSYEIMLRPVEERDCFLDDSQLRDYLCLARMIPSPENGRSFRITLNGAEGFIPPGLLFGLIYAWYLDSSYAEIMEYEMSVLRWSPQKLIPCQLEERERKQALVNFFRKVVFKHPD